MRKRSSPPDGFVWKSVEGFDGLYFVSPNGDVWSTRNGRMLKPGTHTNGYVFVCLYPSEWKKVKTYRVHRLVAEAYLDKQPEKPYVNHKNGIVSDNSVENLEWVSHSENILHSYKMLGRKTNPNKGCNHHNSRMVTAFNDKETKSIAKSFTSINEAAEYAKVFRTAINQAISKGYKSGGFWWRYA